MRSNINFTMGDWFVFLTDIVVYKLWFSIINRRDKNNFAVNFAIVSMFNRVKVPRIPHSHTYMKATGRCTRVESVIFIRIFGYVMKLIEWVYFSSAMFIFLIGQNIALEYCDDLETRCVDLLLQNICSPAPFFLYFDISYHTTTDTTLNMTDRNGFQLKHYVHVIFTCRANCQHILLVTRKTQTCQWSCHLRTEIRPEFHGIVPLWDSEVGRPDIRKK